MVRRADGECSMSKRADRRRRTDLILIKRMKDAIQMDDWFSQVPRGKFRKHHPFDCGHSHCFCHLEKILKIPKQNEKLSDLDFDEEMQDME